MLAERGTHSRIWAGPSRARLRFARCCYGHLAGQVGVAVLQGLLDRRWLEPTGDDGYGVTEIGAKAFSAMGIDGAAWQRRAGAGGRGVAYGCLDWSERRDHLAGKLASAMLDHFVAQGWLRRAPGDRALELTPTGRQALGAWVRLGATA